MLSKNKYRNHKRRLNPVALLVLILLLGIAGWYIWQGRGRSAVLQPAAGEMADSLKAVADSTRVVSGQTATSDPMAPIQNATSDQAASTTQVSPQATPELPLATLFAERKPRMKKSGWYILIVKASHELRLYRNGALYKSYRVALGKNTGDKQAVGDLRTPEGHFYINYTKDSRAWTHDFKDGKGEIPGAYGPWYMALFTGKAVTFAQKTWTGIGIHGTHDPSSIGKNISEGCIRLKNEDLLELKQAIDKDTLVPVDIVQAL